MCGGGLIIDNSTIRTISSRGRSGVQLSLNYTMFKTLASMFTARREDRSVPGLFGEDRLVPLFTKFDIIGLGNFEFRNLALSVNLVILLSNG